MNTTVTVYRLPVRWPNESRPFDRSRNDSPALGPPVVVLVDGVDPAWLPGWLPAEGLRC